MDEGRRSGGYRPSPTKRVVIGCVLIGLGVVVGIIAAILG